MLMVVLVVVVVGFVVAVAGLLELLFNQEHVPNYQRHKAAEELKVVARDERGRQLILNNKGAVKGLSDLLVDTDMVEFVGMLVLNLAYSQKRNDPCVIALLDAGIINRLAWALEFTGYYGREAALGALLNFATNADACKNEIIKIKTIVPQLCRILDRGDSNLAWRAANVVTSLSTSDGEDPADPRFGKGDEELAFRKEVLTVAMVHASLLSCVKNPKHTYAVHESALQGLLCLMQEAPAILEELLQLGYADVLEDLDEWVPADGNLRHVLNNSIANIRHEAIAYEPDRVRKALRKSVFIDSFKAELDELAGERLDEADARVAECQDRLSAEIEARKEAEAALEAGLHELSELRSIVEETELGVGTHGNFEQLQEQFCNLEGLNDAAAAEIEHFVAETADLRAENNRLCVQLDSKDGRMESLQEELNAANHEVRVAMKQVAHLSAQGATGAKVTQYMQCAHAAS